MFPLEAREGGVLKRTGHTEATVDLAMLAGLKPCGLCCEIMREDGTMMRTTELLAFAEKFEMTVITVADQADSSAFLAHIQENPSAFVRNGFHGCVQLFSAVTARRTKYVPRQAFGMYPH